MLTPERFYQQLQRLDLPSPLWVAYSGGLDSHVLLHLLAQTRQQHPDLALHALHIDHGLSPYAADWRKHCQRVCQELGIHCQIAVLDRSTLIGSGLEAGARQARYRIFADTLASGGTLLTAHHRDDQAETVLLRLLRGAGNHGLSAIPERRALGAGVLARPLLAFTRAQLQQYAQAQQLHWIEDESNNRLDFDRNYLRHEIVPLLNKRWPGASATLARAASHQRESTILLQELAEQDWQQIQGSVADTLSIPALMRLIPARQRNLLRFWLQQLGFTLPSERQLQQLQQDCLICRDDATPIIQWSGVEIRRFNDHLYAMPPLAPHDTSVILPWRDLTQPIQLPAGLGQLTFTQLQQMSALITENANITVRFRQGGERITLPGRQGSYALKKLFQQWQVAPWLRDRIPLIYVDNQLVVVFGYAVADCFVGAAPGDRPNKFG